MCVVPENLIFVLFTESSMLACKSSDIVINDQDIDDDSVECTKMKHPTFCEDEFVDLFSPSSTSGVRIIMTSTTDNDFDGSISLAT